VDFFAVDLFAVDFFAAARFPAGRLVAMGGGSARSMPLLGRWVGG
jgi:hypothetical protein